MSRRRTTMVIVDGAEVRPGDIRTTHDADQPVATGSIVLKAPRPHQVEIGAPIDIYAGYDGATLPIFSGSIAEYDTSFDGGGGAVRVELEGPSKPLFYPYFEDRGFYGPHSLNVWWRSLCHAVGVSRYAADATTDPDGITISLGDNPDYRGGWIPIEGSRSPGGQIDRVVRHFGYRSFDTPTGARLQRISGLPTEPYENLLQYVEGENVLSIERTETIAGMVNVVDVRGAEFQAPDTSEVSIRSFTGAYVPDDRYGVTEVNTLLVRDDILGSQALADAARKAYEIDRSSEQFRFRWTVAGDPARVPGEQVALRSPTVNGSTSPELLDRLLAQVPVPVWLMHVSHLLPERSGWITTMEGWAGTGQIMPAGDDTEAFALLGQQGVHLGNEWLAHYRNTSPNGNVSQYEHHIPFPVPKTYTTLTIRGIHHGSNSFVRNQNSTASRFEIWQFGERVASGEMPRSNEWLEKRLPYNDGRVPLEDGTVSTNINYFWDTLVVPLTGRLEPDPLGENTYLAIISGEDRDVGDHDDLEVANVVLHAGGIGVPVPIS